MKRKKYILTAEQAKAHKWGVVWYIISWILGAVIAYFYTRHNGWTMENFILSLIIYSGGVLALYRFRRLCSKILFGSGILLYVASNLVVKVILFVVTYLIVAIPCFLIGWAILLADTIMLFMKRPLVYEKLEYEYINE